jgi:glutamate/tyrosine decarboxylase-like PLP-dependent enzyme
MRKDFQPALEAALNQALEYFRTVDDRPVGATVSLETLRRRLCKEWNHQPMLADDVVNELAADIEGGLNNSVNARFYAWVIGGSLPSALAADWLTSTWDQNAGLYAVSPASAIVEEAVGMWLKSLFRLPTDASFALVTGCQMAHITCLAAARNWLLGKHGWGVEEQGMSGSPRIRIFCGERHGTIDRAVRLLGFGSQSLTKLAVDSAGALDPAAVENALRELNGQPAILLLQAGDVNTGSFDNFETLVPLARRYGAWTHVDGAFGLYAAASPRFEHLVRGIHLAHSWATDGHKWLNVPYDCGYAFVAESEAHRATMTYQASYLTQQDVARDPMDWNPEFSRRARGFATYAALRELGRLGVQELIERCCDSATELIAGLGELDGVTVVRTPIINQGLVSFPDPSGAISNEWNDAVIAAIAAEGTAYFSGTTTVNDRRAMRVSVCNWQTSHEDVVKTVAAVERVLEKMRRDHQLARAESSLIMASLQKK